MERDDGESGPLHIAMEQLTVFGLDDPSLSLPPPPPPPVSLAQHLRNLESDASSSPPPSPAAGPGPVPGLEPLAVPGPPLLLQGPAEQIQLQQQQPRKKSVNMTECVPVPSSEHVAEIVGRQ
eukprot:g36450.t1